MWIGARIGSWLQIRPGRLMLWPVLAAAFAAACVCALFEFAVHGAPRAARVVFDAVLAAAVAYVAMRHYRGLMRHRVTEAEERLRLSDQLAQERILMRALMDHSPDHIYFKDRDSRFLRINRSHAQFFGLSDPADAIGKTDFEVFSAEHAQQAFDDEQAILRTGRPMLNKVEKETWRDGRVTWASTSKLPLRDARGEVMGTFGISRDVTEQYSRELQVRQLSLAVEQSPDVVIVTDVDGRITYVNPRFTEVTGFTPLEAVGQNPRILRSGRTPPSVYEELWATIRAGRVWSGELVNRRKGGDLYWSRLLVAPLRDDQGQVVQFVAVGEDITARKEAEAARQAMLDGLHAVLEIADDLIACDELDEVFRCAVERARDRLGLDRVTLSLLAEGGLAGTYGTNLRGETTDERGRRGPLPDGWAEWLAGRRGTERWRAEQSPLREWDGHALVDVGHGPVIATPVRAAERVIGVLQNDFARRGGSPDPVRQEVVAVFASVLGNVIARKQAELEQQAAESRQRDWMERTDRLNSLGLLAAGMAHEINNPLQGMLSHLHAAARAAPADFAGRSSLLMVERGIETISGLVRKLLVLGGSSDIGGERAECGECIDFVLQLVESQLAKAHVTVEKKAAPAKLSVTLPRRELCQVLINLFINARDAMPEGGVLAVGAVREGDEAVLSIRDSGQGISPENLRRIFTPFFTTKGGRGTGLGLPVANALVRGGGGRIEVESEPGKGSLFRLRLPLAGAGGPHGGTHPRGG